MASEFKIIEMILSDRQRSEAEFRKWWESLDFEEKNMAIWVATDEDLSRRD